MPVEKTAGFLAKFKVGDLESSKKPLVAISHDSTILDAFKVLKENQILSVPMYQLKTDGKRSYEGIVDVFDLMYYVVFKQGAVKDVLSQPVKKAIGHSFESSRLSMLLQSETLARAAEELSSGIHRALVADNETIVTQSDLVKFILEHHSEWTDTLKKTTVATLFHGKPLTVFDTTTARTAFKKIFIHKVQAVSIVNGNDAIAGALSASDLRGIMPESFDLLESPALLFLSKLHGKVPEPIVVHLQVSLESVIEKMFQFKTHRVWVVGAADAPIGVITMTDIIRVFLENE